MKKPQHRWWIPFAAVILLPILIFALVCVCRINRHVRDYPYAPELPQPGPSVDFKYDDAFADLYIRWCNLLDNGMTAAWRAPEGVVKKDLRVTTQDGRTIGGYLLEPEGCENETLPAMLFCHGGGFFLTMMNSQLDAGAVYARELYCRVYLPQYRTSLDAPYPTPLNDCYDTLRQIAGSPLTDTERVMIYGGSAGGCLAAEVTHRCCNEGLLMPLAQMLIYPVTDRAQHYPSLIEYQYATWPREANIRMWKLYLDGYEPTAADYAVPMEHESFPPYPKTYLEAAEMDILCDQDLAYAGKMKEAGVEVALQTVPGAYHGYDGDVTNSLVRRMLDLRVAWLRELLDAGA